MQLPVTKNMVMLGCSVVVLHCCHRCCLLTNMIVLMRIPGQIVWRSITSQSVHTKKKKDGGVKGLRLPAGCEAAFLL